MSKGRPKNDPTCEEKISSSWQRMIQLLQRKKNYRENTALKCQRQKVKLQDLQRKLIIYKWKKFQKAGTQYQPMNIQAQTVGQTDLSQYTNPYESQVVDQTMADLERARQMQQNVSDYQMGRAGAFGGSRHGIADAESNRNFYDRAGELAGNLRQQGFTQAQNIAGQDANRMMQASIANQGAGLQGAGQRLQAAGQLGRLSQQGFDMGRTLTGDVREQGNMQQLMQQQLIDAAKQQYAGYTGAPASSIGYLSQALGASTIPQSQTTQKNPGLFDYLTLAMGS